MTRIIVFFFLLYTAFSTENYKEDALDTLLQLKTDLNRRAQDLQQKEERHRAQVKVTEQRLKRREKSLQRREENVKQTEERLLDWKKRHVAIAKNILAIQRNKVNPGELNLYPNKSSVQVFRNEKNEISWKDPNELIANKKKNEIAHSLQFRGKEMSNGIFGSISSGIFPQEAPPFMKKLIYEISDAVDVDYRDRYQGTPTHLAAKFDADEAISKLIDKGAEIDAVNEDGSSALHYAAKYGSEDSLKILLENGAHINVQNKYGETPLMWAAHRDHSKIVKILIASGADVFVQKQNGKRALHVAMGSSIDILKAQEEKLNEPKCQNM